MKTVSINQPGYLPWIGYYSRIARCDVHVVLDHVQYEKNSFNNRNKIKTPNGPVWLTIPIITKGCFKTNSLNSVAIDNTQNWVKKHYDSIFFSYKKAPYFSEYISFFDNLYKKNWERLIDIVLYVDRFLFGEFNLKTEVLRSSEMGLQCAKSDLVLEICDKLGADRYYSGALGKNYLDLQKFHEHGIDVFFQDFKYPLYEQLWGDFVPNLSIVDMLFNLGAKGVKQILKSNNYLL